MVNAFFLNGKNEVKQMIINSKCSDGKCDKIDLGEDTKFIFTDDSLFCLSCFDLLKAHNKKVRLNACKTFNNLR